MKTDGKRKRNRREDGGDTGQRGSDKIRGADGVQTGEVEIVDLTNNVVLTSYNVTFTEVDS